MRKLSKRIILKHLQVKLNLFHLSIICLLLIILFSSFSVSSRLKKLRKKRRKECMILANGPSLNQDIHLIIPYRTSYDIMVLNFFCNSEYFKIATLDNDLPYFISILDAPRSDPYPISPNLLYIILSNLIIFSFIGIFIEFFRKNKDDLW